MFTDLIQQQQQQQQQQYIYNNGISNIIINDMYYSHRTVQLCYGNR